MSNKRPPIAVIIIIVLVILAVAGYYIWQNQVQNGSTVLTASGTIESTSYSVSPELSGKVAEVKADEGDVVKAGDVLLVLDGSVLKSQQNQAAVSLETAKAAVVTAQSNLKATQVQYDLVVQSVLAEDIRTRTEDWKKDKPSEFDQPGWYFTRMEQFQNSEAQVKTAEAALKVKTDELNAIQQKMANSSFLTAEQELLDARKAFQIADDVLDQANGASSYEELKDAAETLYDDAKDRLNDAEDVYDDALTSDEADDILEARAEVRVAQETYDTALDHARSLQTGLQSLKLTSSQTVVDQALAGLDQAEIAVKQAQANLDVLDTQISLLTITSPRDGVVLTRMVEPGEVITAGYSALTIANINEITITVYVPENRIGEVTLGQSADVNVDTFADATFSARVIHISDQAEFTPRNVQTVEGRKNTVFAVKLQLDDITGKLKPGMPADVLFK